MTEEASKGLAAVLDGKGEPNMHRTMSWGVAVGRLDGALSLIEDHGGWVYRDREAYEASRVEGNRTGLMEVQEWGEWDGSEQWARKLSRLLGSEEYWHSGGGIWLVFYRRPDGRFAVIGSESGGIYSSYEEFHADLLGEKAENHHFV
jgi:hypothetical protein